ncbi:hypothetical protein Gotri_000014 [Gossypium trilobum]|uniref:Uncharacterized protein n=1 Tax=Gossypium trilobum TaxID=34281 RepID=A0A7J9FU30_9ROSI|nr:hypothetical protein [Gossypium trilobum]
MRKEDETGAPVWDVGSPKEQEEKKKGVKKVETWKWLNESPLTHIELLDLLMLDRFEIGLKMKMGLMVIDSMEMMEMAILGVLFKICMVALYVEGVAAPNLHLGGFDREGLPCAFSSSLCIAFFFLFFETLISTGVFVVSLSLWFSQRRSRVCLVFGGWFIHCSLAYLSSSMVDDINVLLERLNFSEKELKRVINTNMKSANIQGYEAWVVGKIMSGEKVNREVMYHVLKYLWFTKEEVNFVALNEGVTLVKFSAIGYRTRNLNLTP